MGAEPDPGSKEGGYVYIVPETVKRNLVIGPISRSVNWGYHIGSLVPKYFLFFGPHLPMASAMVSWSVFELSHIQASMAAYNLVDLKARQALSAYRFITGLKRIPGITAAYLVSGGRLHWKGIMAQSRDIENVVVFRTRDPLPDAILKGEPHPNWNPAWGSPVLVPDPKRAVFFVRLKIGGEKQPKEWKVTLEDIMNGIPMPEKVQESWKKSLKAAKQREPGFLHRTARHLIFRPLPELPADHIRLDARLKVPGVKRMVPLEGISIGKDVVKLLDNGFSARVLAGMGLALPGRLKVSQRVFKGRSKSAACPLGLSGLALTD
jgi:hypothetical protein